jgi:hypothetical protein
MGKMARKGVAAAASVLAGLMMAGCGPGAVTKSEKPGYTPGGHGADGASHAEPPAPTTEILPGCTAWTKVTGAGLSIWAQTCAGRRLTADANGKALVIETLDGAGAVIDRGAVIEVFDAPAGGAAGLAAMLMAAGGAPAGAACALEASPNVLADRPGVTRYILAPTGAAKTTWERLSGGPNPPEDPPCGRYGVGFVGDRIIQIEAAHPDKAVFVELGSEIQMFDANTLTFAKVHTDEKPSKAGGH